MSDFTDNEREWFQPPLRDAKEALTSSRKPDVSHLRGPFMAYVARACEYGCDKYERANYLRLTDGVELGPDFQRLRTYLAATIRHVVATLDAMEQHQADNPNLESSRVHPASEMLAAVYSRDTDESPDAPVGASNLPHLAHAAAALQMAIVQAVDAGLLPADPGTPWKAQGIPGFSSAKDSK